MALAVPWIFLFLSETRAQFWTGIAFTSIGLLCCAYIVLNEPILIEQYGSLEGPVQLILAMALLLTVLEMARRAIGWPLP